MKTATAARDRVRRKLALQEKEYAAARAAAVSAAVR